LRKAIDAKVIELGKHIVRMTSQAGSGHPSSALSLGHVVATLMYRQMRYDPANPWHEAADRLVLSEGHAVPVVYAAYADLGGVVGWPDGESTALTVEELTTLRAIDSVLDGHPNPAEGFPFFDAATGSLGQGLSAGAGLALAARLRGFDKRIFVLIGDGESREGQIWEAADFIVDQKLTNVCAIFNCNGQGQADYVSRQQSAEVLQGKLEAFGWQTRLIDGHDADQIAAALAEVGKTDKPLAIIARTTKGWGVSALQAHTSHGKPLPAAEVDGALAELDGMYAKLGVSPDQAGSLAPPAPSGSASPLPSGPIQLPPFAEGIAAAGLGEALQKGKLATRRAYGAALLALGKADRRIVALDGDVSNSTFAQFFAKAFPDRFFECKIAEQNMVSTAVGLAAGGFIPFVSSFAKFLARAYDQIEMANITRANIKLVGSHSGVSLGADGPSQMGLLDVPFFRGFTQVDDGRGQPACVVFQPADAVAAYRCTELMANHVGMCYMRTHRPDMPLLYPQDATFEIGGVHPLREGDAVTLVGSGFTVFVALAVAERLAREGIECAVFDAYSLPVVADPILAAARAAAGVILVIEDNYCGGWHAALAEAAARAGDVRVDGMTCGRIPKSGRTAEDVLAFVGLSAGDIAARVKQLLE